MSELAGPADQVAFTHEDALFDTVAYQPWHSPLGTEPVGVDPGDRRIVGRLHGEPVTVTDLPPHTIYRGDPPGYVHAHQNFERASDLLDWVAGAATTTRFFGVARNWTGEQQHAAAAAAVRAGLAWDIDGNIVLFDPPGYHSPLTTPPHVEDYRLVALPAGTWSITPADDDTDTGLNGPTLQRVLDAVLHHIGVDGDPFTFAVEFPVTDPPSAPH